MDPKASAKAKRSHTQHGRRTHPPPAAIAHKKKAAGDKTTSTHRALPSNWDRYDDTSEEIDSNLSTKEVVDGEIGPKSKGADFGYLIEQARSQPKDFGFVGSQGSSSFDEFSFDFMQGVSSMLSVRGKGLLSVCGDDNFIVDDDPTSSYEVPFLSMDLNALSAQLSKLKLSQRLFIEADLLLEELNIEESETSSASKKLEISEPADSNPGFDSQAFLSSSVLVNNANTQTRGNSVFKDGQVNLRTGAEQDKPHNSPLHFNVLEASKSSKQIEQPSRRELQEPILQMATHTISDSQQKETTKFEAAAAEAELDMLLDSFSETSLSGSMPSSLTNDNSALKSSSFGSIASESGQDPDSSRNIATASIDDLIDDLLTETSLCLDGQKQTTLPQKQESFPENSRLGSRSTNAFNLLSSRAVSDSIDDSLDYLLAETSLSLGEKQHPTNQQNKGAVSSSKGLSPHTSTTVSKAMDDFDSWIDTL